MTIEEVVERKVVLCDLLTALSMTNTHGKTQEELISLNLREVEIRKALFEIERKITDYVEGVYNDH